MDDAKKRVHKLPGKKYTLVLLTLWASVLHKVVEDAESPLKVRPRSCRLQKLRHLNRHSIFFRGLDLFENTIDI